MRTLIVLLVSSALLACADSREGAGAGTAERASATESVRPPPRQPLADTAAERVYRDMRNRLDDGAGWREVRYLEFDWVLWRGAPVLTRSYRYAPWEGDFRVEADLSGERLVALGNWKRPRLTRVWLDGAEIEGDSAVTLRRRAERMFELDANQLLLPFRWDDPRLRAAYAGRETLEDGTAVEVVEITSASSTFREEPRRLFQIDPESGLPLRTLEYRGASDTDPSRVLRWTGWEEHGPVRLSIRRETGGESQMRFENVTVRSFLPPERFQPPGG